MTRTVVRLELAERSAQNARYLVHLEDEGRVEAVVYRQDTVCLSTQVGCAVACPFCASGQNGLSRNLTFEEMRDTLDALLSDHALKRVTLSGVGEPLHNPASVAMLDECRRRDLGLSLTTSGGPLRRLEAWLRRPHRGLTISVHAGTEAVRRKAVPKGPALEPLFQCLAATLPALSRRRQKKTALAYLLVRGLNDGRDELEAFATRVSALPVQPAVHLYALNAIEGGAFQAVARSAYEAAYARLSAHGLRVRMSSTARIQANGGCGTLVARRAKRDTRRLRVHPA